MIARLPAIAAAVSLYVAALSTPALAGEGGKPKPTHADVRYGPHERNVLDFYRARSDKPAPVAIYIHGGGFRGGSKNGIREQALRSLLDAGISVAAFNYRFVQHAPLPAAHHDCRRALQTLRSKAAAWNIDPSRIGAFGGSAGAQLCMYLAFHDDMARPDSDDPIARESTRLTCVATSGGQTTMDVEWWKKHIPGYDSAHRNFYESLGAETKEQYDKTVAEISALSLISRDDPPIHMSYGMSPTDPVPTGRRASGWKVHHVRFGVALKAKMDALGIEADLAHPGSDNRYASNVAFFKRHLLAREPVGLVAASGVQGGLVVHVGGGRSTAAFRINDRYVVQGLQADPARVAEARQHVLKRNLSGPVSVIRWDGGHLPYADNLVSLLIVDEPKGLADGEALRVLSPRGVALIKSGEGRRKLTKLWPEEIDEWTHYLHGPDNNAVAEDTRVAPPRHMQWVSGPRWGRSHDHLSSVSAVVSARGRIFSIVDDGPTASVKADSKWMLVARDAFNGVLLWQKPISPWENQLRPFRSGPAELPRRLVAVGDRVYATLGYGKPAVALDAATGKLLRTYEGTDNAHEIVCEGGKLFVVVSKPLDEESPTSGKVLRRFPVWRGSYLEFTTKYMPKHVRAFDAESGRLIWKKDDADAAHVLPLTLIVGDGRVFFQNAGHLIALEPETGKVIWKTPRPSVRHRYAWLTPTLVVAGGVVLSADRAADKPVDTGGKDKASPEWRVSANHLLKEGLIMAFSAADGKQLWTAPTHEGFNSPADVFVIGGKVYSGVLAWGRQPGITSIYDLKTGKVVATKPRDQDLYTFGFGHHRCHRNRATTKYIIQGRAGIEFLDVSDFSRTTADHWVRGACQWGSMPANGLMYAPTHPCACYITAKLNGYNALSGKRATPPPKASERLEEGPAFDRIPQSPIPNPQPNGWPTLRHDNARSGSTTETLPARLKPCWERPLPGPLTAVTVAAGRLYVARREANTVCALKADDGSPLWSFTAGGRVDSPPTVFGEAVYFGSADGWIYCLRAADGKLVWRFRVAPESRQIVAYNRLESAWPVHGNVLVCKGPRGRPVAYAAAGRTSYVDGGVYLCGVHAVTGELQFRRRIRHRDPKTGNEPQNVIKGVTMPGAIPDVLATDGTSLFMRHQRFDLAGRPLEQNVDHLFCSAGFLDDTWWHRTYLQIGSFMRGGYGGWTAAGNSHISGKALVRNDKRAFGFGRKGYTITGSHLGLQSECHLFAADIKTGTPQQGRQRRRGGRAKAKVQYVWSKPIPIFPRAMLLAGETLFLAGASNVDDFFAGDPKQNVLFWAVSTKDGSKLTESKLKASPVYDSFAACGGRLYFTTVDGRVVCWK